MQLFESLTSRRSAMLLAVAASTCRLPTTAWPVPCASAQLSDSATSSLSKLSTGVLADASQLAELDDPAFGYRLSYPSGWESKPKPVKTHAAEAILQSPRRGVSLGVTVDPVKIDSLEQFGTPEQVADRVLAVEETRDGVLDVQLRAISEESGQPSYYTIEYFVESTRGKKVYLCKYCIARRRLYVLQAQAKVDDYDDKASGVQEQLRNAVASFRVAA
mmetsp:Transcript_48550/g.105255  ORF Transcript_48550/g.105255 Transcript_48550/m.105255 type:complete len:218 (-) Transcript_48550:94-747(-)